MSNNFNFHNNCHVNAVHSHNRIKFVFLFQVLNGLQEDNFEMDIIGPDLYDENHDSNDIELAKQFVMVTKGATAPFHHIMQYLLFHKKKLKNPMPWNVDLSIGPNIKIPVSVYIRLRDEPVVKNWLKAVKDRVTSTASTSEGIMRQTHHVNEDNQTVVDRENIIKGYNYGQTIIPFGECDKTMLYESGQKCLSVYGFTHATNINWQTLCGDGLQYIFGRKGNKKAQNTVRCLVECLHELKLVGLVRRVYNNGNAPKMFAVMPVIDTNNFICLSMAEVCFKEDIKNITFPSTNLKKFACTDKQVNAFKDLIHAMDLTKAYDETFDEAEAFPVAETVSPSAQYVLDCISFRAMNPGKPLPQPRDEIMMLFKQPPLIEKRSREPLEKLKQLFTLNEVEIKTRNKKNNDVQIDNIPMKPLDDPIINNEGLSSVADAPKLQMPKKTNEVFRIGTIDPIEDYKTLSNKDKKLSDLAPDMTDAIESLIYYNIDGNYNKALDAMSFFRSECVKAEPSHYNSWLQKFRTALVERKKQEVIDFITERQLSFILKEENPLSTYETEDSHDDSQAYENDTIPNSTDLNLPSTVNDMFDEM